MTIMSTHGMKWPIMTDGIAVCNDFVSNGHIDKLHRILKGTGTNILEKNGGKLYIVHEHLNVIPD